MALNYQILMFIIFTSSIATKQVSCLRFSFTFPGKPSLSFIPSPSPPPSTITSFIHTLKKPVSHVPQEVKKACKKTDFKKECVTSIAHVILDDKHKPIPAFDAEVKAFDNALGAANAEIISSSSKAINVEKSPLSTCKEMYGNARDDVHKAMKLIATRGDKYDVNIRLSAALTFVEDCHDALSQHGKGHDSHSLKNTNKLLMKLASNCLALGNVSNSDD